MSKIEAEVVQLRMEIQALKALLTAHGIEFPQPPDAEVAVHAIPELSVSPLSKDAKVKLFRRLFHGRDDVCPGDAPRVLLATGRLIGEGFDHPPLDTLMLAMPISWHGTLRQYAGRLHREHAGKSEVLIYDYVDTGNVMLERMWDKRQRGYRAMGYRIDDGVPNLI